MKTPNSTDVVIHIEQSDRQLKLIRVPTRLPFFHDWKICQSFSSFTRMFENPADEPSISLEYLLLLSQSV